MILTPHAVFGAALASALHLSPAYALAAGFVSHLLLDTIPHWDYHLKSGSRDPLNPLNNDISASNPNFRQDLMKIAFDACLGVGLSLFFLSLGVGVPILSVLAGAIGGILPDALQFVYMKIRREPFTSLQHLHTVIMHSTKEIENPTKGLVLYSIFLTTAFLLGGWFFFSW